MLSCGVLRAGLAVLFTYFAHKMTFLVIHKAVPYSVIGIR
jgi:hypothetical protein